MSQGDFSELLDHVAPRAETLVAPRPHLPACNTIGERPGDVVVAAEESAAKDKHPPWAEKKLGSASFEDLLSALTAEHVRLQTEVKQLKRSCGELREGAQHDGNCSCDCGGLRTTSITIADIDEDNTGATSETVPMSESSEIERGRMKFPMKRSTSKIFAQESITLSTYTPRETSTNWSTKWPHFFFSSKWFEEVVALIVLFDVVFLGWEAEARIHGDESKVNWLFVTTMLVKLFFFFEVLLRFFTYGAKFILTSNLMKLDILVVLCSLLDIVFSNTLRVVGGNYISGSLNIVRFFRLLRVARTGRKYPGVRPVWHLLSGLKASLVTMWWVVVLMGVFSYGFAIIGVEMIPPMDRVASNVVDELALAKFGTLADSTMSLLQIITLDDASEVYRPLIMLGTSRLFCALYFGCFIVIVAIAFMNLVTAAIVEESFSQAAQNKEMQQEVEHQRQRALIPRLREMFELIDLDGSGEVSWDEIQQSPIELQEELSRMTKTDDLYEIFQLLDDDNSGAVGIDEFLDGILKSMKSTSGDVTINLLIRKLMRQVASLSASKLA
eukprot:TRINITY_DN21385_c0_g1_i4.p1 TRINITY_DN21385_c0_g1~~TRINITY_DN21385_c0_g1_i4.p1  ORF type:complete len:555 (+),score=83.71 TRINITY_DN21385_c0_g1_i4:72-1736(+)